MWLETVERGVFCSSEILVSASLPRHMMMTRKEGAASKVCIAMPGNPSKLLSSEVLVGRTCRGAGILYLHA